MSFVNCEVKDKIAVITINRPEALNALNSQVLDDLEAAFDMVLSSALAAGTPAADMPDSIVVITDMEFDVCANPNWLFYDALKAKYAAAGYDMPNIVFWNVASRNDTFHASFDKKGVQLASGQSASVFATLTSGVQLTPHDYMVSVLNNERYAQITV